ncbi:MAG: aminotransferase class III-fold pyridoxal phosphate-dependent enzyme [Anaerolineae bacterium]|nr:aminotransferase class III-fold pyridoxal phosphate-dependent enzyme [Anaerolineae bacterium]
MIDRDYSRLLAELFEEYAAYSPKSRQFHERAQQSMVDGGSHTLRLIEPFPPRIVTSRGAWIEDVDQHRILDFWQGHLANVLGHNPRPITEPLARAFEEHWGLQTGFTDEIQIETAEILCRQTGAEKVRFTTSGTLCTMYAIMLSRAYTGRRMVMKVGGGWHGAQPWALKGIHFVAEDLGFQKVESAGVPAGVTDRVIVSNFNDPQRLTDHFREYGDQLACFIVEPFMGVGGNMAASQEYLQTARELTAQYGVVLVFDEVIAGFRFRAGNLGAVYGIQPDLTSYGKSIGGGMPVAAVAGRSDVLKLVARNGRSQVQFSGGTYSAHPISMLAARTAMNYLVEHEHEIYPRLAQLGARTRQIFEDTFRQEGIHAVCTGGGEGVLPGSSLFMLHFPYQEGRRPTLPEDCCNPAVCDVTLSQKVLDLVLLLEDVFMLHSHGAVSTAHTEDDMAFLEQACRHAARRIKPYLTSGQARPS